MRRKFARRSLLLAALLAVTFAAAPALGQELGEPTAFSLSLSDLRLSMAGEPELEIGLALSLAAGMNQAGDRGLLSLELVSGSRNVIALQAALENGRIKAHAQNDLGGLPHILAMPADALVGMGRAFLPVDTTRAPQFAGLQKSLLALWRAAEDPAYAKGLQSALGTALESALGLEPAGESEVTLFGQIRPVRVSAGRTDLAGLLAALSQTASADELVKEFFAQAVLALEESGVLGRGVTLDNLPRQMAREGNELAIAITSYAAQQDVTRLQMDMAWLHRGQKEGAILLTLDVDGGQPALSLEAATSFPDRPKADMVITLEARGQNGGGQGNTYAGLMLEQLWEGGKTISLQTETRRGQPDEGGVRAIKTLFSGAVLADPGQDSYAVAIQYDGQGREEGGLPSHQGRVGAELFQNGISLGALSFQMAYQAAFLPEGELLAGDLAVLEVQDMTAEQAQALTQAANTLYVNTLVLLLQTPGAAGLLGGFGQ